MPRLFTALEIPRDAALSLSLLRGGLPGARWIDVENYHITLRFIGDVEGHVADEVANALDRVRRPAFSIGLSGVGAFGSKNPHAIWAGVTASSSWSARSIRFSSMARGSPFAANSMLLPPRQVPEFGTVPKHKKPALQQAYASNGGAIAALVLGVFGLVLAPLRFEGAIVGAVGLTMGIWGLYSQRRGWALAGLILCCLAIAIGMYTGVFWLFKYMNNATPWEY